jgi:hypothetical protein
MPGTVVEPVKVRIETIATGAGEAPESIPCLAGALNFPQLLEPVELKVAAEFVAERLVAEGFELAGPVEVAAGESR